MSDYSPNNILITGGAGFIGSNFIYHILKDNVNVVNIDCMSYCSTDMREETVNRWIKNNELKSTYKFIEQNITGINVKVFEENNIDTVIHFAAQSHVDNSFGNSVNFTMDNVLGTHIMLECCREYGKIKRFIHISTDEVYGEVDMDNEGCIEKSILNPTNPYAATKAAAEMIVSSYYHSFKLPVIITRGNNVYGPRQYPEKVIPAFISNLLNNQKCEIHGKGIARRNFIHVNDVCTAIETILYKGKINEIYNIGTTNEYNVMEILQKLVSVIKNDSDYLQYANFVEDRLFNDFRYCIDATKLRKLGWKEQIPFMTGLKDTINWYSNSSNRAIFSKRN
jgi:dTDP-glucose 4,6-dehydratase